ncbi:CHAT domain-containing protein [Mycena galopus ATCC 62051]|nr:CHAT domain-containing protein [Mycena galopus ATCC 62051]
MSAQANSICNGSHQLASNSPDDNTADLDQEIVNSAAVMHHSRDSNLLSDQETLDVVLEQRYQMAADHTPQDHPNRANHLESLVFSLAEQHQRWRNTEDLERIIQASQEALELTPAGNPFRADRLQDFARALQQRYWMLGNLDDLEQSLLRWQEALSLTPKGHPDRAGHLQGLGLSLGDQYRRLGGLEDLEAALQQNQEAVDLIPEGHPKRATYLSSYAVTLSDQYHRSQDLTDLVIVIQKKREALDLISDGDPYRPYVLQSLGVSLWDRYRRLGELEDLQDALQMNWQVFDLTPEGDLGRAGCLHNLAITLEESYHRLGDLYELEGAMQIKQELVHLKPEGHPDRLNCLESFAVSLSDHYQKSGDVARMKKALDLTTAGDIDRANCLKDTASLLRDQYHRLGEVALQFEKDVISLTPREHPDMPNRLRTLASSLIDRYHRTGDLADLEIGIQTQQEAAALIPEGHTNRPGLLQNLVVSLTDRYKRLGDIKDLERALEKGQESLNIVPEGHPERPGLLQSIGASLSHRYERFRDLNDLESALHKYNEALALTPVGHPQRPGNLQNVAASLSQRYQRLGDLKDLEDAVQVNQEAVALTPETHPDRPRHLQNLAVSLADQYRKLGHLKDLESAIQTKQEAVNLTKADDPRRPHRLQNLAVSFIDRYQRLRDPNDLQMALTNYKDSFRGLSESPLYSWKHALQWAFFATKFPALDSVAAYTAAFTLLPELLWIGHSIPMRHDTIHQLNIGQVTSMATQTCINLGNLTAAVEIVEQGIATTFQQMLQLKTNVDGMGLISKHVRSLHKLSSDLYGTNSPDPITASERYQLLKDIRKQPGLGHFLLPKPYNILQNAAQRGPVVILTSYADSCDGIIVLHSTSEPISVPLPNVTQMLLESQQTMLNELVERCDVRLRKESAPTSCFGQLKTIFKRSNARHGSRLTGHREGFTSKSTKQCFEDLLTWLWTNIVCPVYQVLEANGISSGRLWWLLSGAFTKLPLHACSPNDNFIHSYTATLGSLLEAQAKTSSQERRFGVVGVTHTGHGKTKFLKGVGEEVKTIASIITKPGVNIVEYLEGEKATVDAVMLQLQDCSWVHLACHGTQDLAHPTKSCLLLYEGELELEKILQMPLSNAEFVFLAACQTAMGDAVLGNESFHLGGGFIAAGFRGAVGTLWSMNDADGPLVAKSFYSYLFRDGRQPQATDAAEALHHAVKDLKARKVPYEQWVPFIHIGV